MQPTDARVEPSFLQSRVLAKFGGAASIKELNLAVGNFGNGWIAAFNPVTGEFQDYLRDTTGALVTIPGLWALAPGNDGSAGNAKALYYSAGGASETSGVWVR